MNILQTIMILILLFREYSAVVKSIIISNKTKRLLFWRASYLLT